MRKENDLDTWRLLFRVGELGSVTRAAEEVGVEPSSVSRRLSALEKSLGCDLLLRSPRSIGLNVVGQETYERLRPLIAEWDSVISHLGRQSDASDGVIRISAAIGFGQEVLTPLTIRFQQEHPAIRIELNLNDRPADPTRDNVDIVFRYGPIEDENLVARRMGTVDFPICASPAYLQKYGEPQHPRDLAQHTVIFYDGERRPATSQISNGTDNATVEAATALRFNNVLAIREAGIAGAGICLDVPLHSCASALRSGQLVRILPGWQRPSIDSYAVRVASRHPPRRVTVFLNWIFRERARLRRDLINEVAA